VTLDLGAAAVGGALAGLLGASLRPLELPAVAAGAILEGATAVSLPPQSALVLVDD
jgi:hypothetical protein